MAICIHIACMNDEQRNRLGEQLHNALVGSPAYISSEIALNYTEPNTKSMWLIVGDDNESNINIGINGSSIIVTAPK